MINSNPIEINKSSLVSLKAEILRKQQEINISRLQEKVPNPVLTKTKKKNEPKKKIIEENVNEEDEELLTRSRQILESKASLYNALSKRASNPTEQNKEITKRCLVQFDRKESVDDDSNEEYHSDEYEPPKNPDEEWVEYVDFLGRTRKCLRKDLEYMKQKDRELSSSVESKRKTSENSQTFVKNSGDGENDNKVDNPEITLSSENELLSSDMRRELLRREWEQQEDDLLKKKNVHYQDVLFNEARSHGVGYYSFSKDEEERSKQQANLNKLREETAKQQQMTSEMKKLREKQLAARLKAARNRKRARMGVPPEPDEPEESQEQIASVEEEERKRRETEKEAEEKRKQDERSKIIRPWDIGKEIVKQHYEYSQEEWVSKQREQRNKEFAPPTTYTHFPKRPVLTEDVELEDKRLFFTSKKIRTTDCSSTCNSALYEFDRDDSSLAESQSSLRFDTESLEDSVVAGLRFLREQSEQRNADNY